MDYTKQSIKELKELCKERKIKGYSNKDKDKIIKLLQPHIDFFYQNDILANVCELSEPSEIQDGLITNTEPVVEEAVKEDWIRDKNGNTVVGAVTSEVTEEEKHHQFAMGWDDENCCQRITQDYGSRQDKYSLQSYADKMNGFFQNGDPNHTRRPDF